MPTRRALLASAALTPLLAAGPASAQEASPPATSTAVALDSGVVYGEVDGEELIMDVYRPPVRDAPRTAVIVIHGGGWTQGYGDRSMMVEEVEDLAGAGYVAFNVGYRLMDGEPGHNVWPAQLDDVQRAVRWVRANAAAYNVDPERIGSSGYSSGAHLAACLGVRETRDNGDPALAAYSSRVACVVSLAGEMDLTIPYPQETDRQIVVNLLGGTAEEVPDAYRDASPNTWVDGASAPFLLMHGARDTIVPVAHARTMEVALHEAGVEVVYFEDPDADHVTWDWSAKAPWTLTFLAHHLRPER